MDKTEARQLVVQAVRESPKFDYQALVTRLCQSLFWRRARMIAITLSAGKEIRTDPIIHKAWSQRKTVAVPKTFPHGQMHFYRLLPQTPLKKNRFGIREPVDAMLVKKPAINLIIVPGVAFTVPGHDRLGWGGGYYDRYLKGYSGCTVALARPQQIFKAPIWPVSSNDVKVQQIIS